MRIKLSVIFIRMTHNSGTTLVRFQKPYSNAYMRLHINPVSSHYNEVIGLESLKRYRTHRGRVYNNMYETNR